MGGSDGLLGLGRAEHGHGADLRAGGGIGDVEGSAARGADPRAVHVALLAKERGILEFHAVGSNGTRPRWRPRNDSVRSKASRALSAW